MIFQVGNHTVIVNTKNTIIRAINNKLEKIPIYE